MRHLPLLAARLYNTPLLLLPSVAETFGSVFRDLMDGRTAPASVVVVGADGQAVLKPQGFAANVQAGEQFADKPHLVTDAGVAVLSITGPLVQRAGQIDADCTPLASYQRLTARFDAMMADPDVRAILLEWDSPGGEVAGAFTLAQRLQAARGGDNKPVWSHANEGAFSAAYLLASATDRVVVPQSGQLGSIGVVMLHIDQSARDAKMGVVFTPIFAGARKVDFNSHAPLSKEARAVGQAEVDRLYDMFVGQVAAARALDVQAVRATEAGIFAANDAKALGLADAVATFDETLAELTDHVHARANGVTHFSFATAEQRQAARHNPGETHMSQHNGAAPAQPAATPSPAAAPPQGSVILTEAELAQRSTAARAEERTRVAAILRAPEAAGRGNLAQALAFDSDMAPEAAVKLLSAAAQEQPPVAAAAPAAAPAATSPLAAAMASVPNPAVGPDKSGTAAETDSPEALAASAIAAARTFTGVK